MNENLSENTKLEEIACKILRSLINISVQPQYLTKWHKENLDYFDEFEKEFEKGLNYEQRKDYDSLISIKKTVESIELDYRLIYGMQIKAAIDEILKNPLKILNLYDKDGTPTREIYKSVKQKMEEKYNG